MRNWPRFARPPEEKEDLVAKKKAKKEKTGSLGFEAKLWAAADLLRNNMDPAEYKHVVLGLLFLKYIEDAFEERREEPRWGPRANTHTRTLSQNAG